VKIYEPAVAGDSSFGSDAFIQKNASSSGLLSYRSAVARYRGLTFLARFLSWGSAALHPRLYAVTRSAGW
jgi:hypothetical protein